MRNPSLSLHNPGDSDANGPASSQQRCRLPAPDDRAGYRPDHLQRDCGCDRNRESLEAGGDFAAWLGLDPKHEPTGDRTTLIWLCRLPNYAEWFG
jgi:hypothetical protein